MKLLMLKFEIGNCNIAFIYLFHILRMRWSYSKQQIVPTINKLF